MDLPRPALLGRRLQRRDEAADAGARVPLRRVGDLRDRPAEPPLAESCAEDWHGGHQRNQTRRRKRQPGVPADEGGVRERPGVIGVGIFSDDTWTIGTADQDGQPIIIRVRSQMPDAAARHGHAQLIVVGWPYDGNATGLPGAEDTAAMRAFEDTIEAGLE